MAQIGKVTFGFYAPDQLREISVCTISEPRTFDATNAPTKDGLYDPRLGPTERGLLCPTCNKTERHCDGHLGTIELPVPCYNPLLFPTLHKLLQIRCGTCHQLRLDKLHTRWHVARIALLDAGQFQHCDLLLRPGKPTADEPDAVEYRRQCTELIESVEKDIKDGILTRTASAHGRVERQKAAKEFYSACRSVKKCDRCGASERKLRRDGASKLFQLPLDAKHAHDERLQGIKAPKAVGARTPNGVFDDSSGSDNDGAPKQDVTSRALYVTSAEARAQLRLLWKNDGESCEALLGAVACRPRINDGKGANKFFLEVLGVPPPRFRPAQTVGGVLAEHPQNVVLGKVLLLSQQIRGLSGEGSAAKLLDLWLRLQGEITNYIDSAKSTNRDQPPGIKQLLEKKEGLFRKHMMGKRVDFCCRSVISPDPFLASGEIGLPVKFARGLDYPEPVTPHNVDYLRRLVTNGPEVWPGANWVETPRASGGVQKTDLKRVQSAKRRAAIAQQLLTTPGQKVGRHVLDGDSVLVNRQPSLHKPSIMAHKVKVLSAASLEHHQTLRMHYANCNAYNADFDGDEINVHFPQSELARAECEVIACTQEQYIVPTDGKPLRGLIQDHIDASVKLSMADCFLTRDQFCQLVYESVRPVIGGSGYLDVNVVQPALLKPELLYTGRQLLSAVLAHVTRKHTSVRRDPLLRHFEGKAKVQARAIGGMVGMDEPSVLVRRGLILRGVLDKASIGSSANGLVHAVFELYGGAAAADLLDALTRLLTSYLATIEGHTCGIGDLVLTDKAEKVRRTIVEETEQVGIEAMEQFLRDRGFTEWDHKGLSQSERAKRRREASDNALGVDGAREALDAHMMGALAPQHSKIVKACLPDGLATLFPKNSFALMVTTGAKGSVVNQSQVCCALGQQSLEGRRVPVMPSGRSLPCFDPHDPRPRAGGFIADRFLTGIRPQEYYFHCMSGREGLIDTAVKTSRSGYLQRCLVKHLEGLRVAYDHTVRDDEGSVVQFLYGDDGLDTTKTHFLTGAKELRFLAANYVDAVDDSTIDVRGHSDVATLARPVQKARRECSVQGLALHARVRARRRVGTKYAKLYSEASVVKVREGSVDVRFDSNGEAQKKTTGVVPAAELETPVNQRFEAWRAGAVSDRVEQLLNDVEAEAPKGLREAVYDKYARSLAAPGEAVGALAAQSVGEPSTQMTLNTFHLAGTGAGNVTLGIPRLREIIMTASTHMKTPQITVPLREHGDSVEQARALAAALTPVSLSDVCDLTEGILVREALVVDKDLIRRKYSATVKLFATAMVDSRFGAGTVPDDARVLAHRLEQLVRRQVMRTTAPARAKLAIIGSAPVPKPKKVVQKDSSDDDDDESDIDDAEAGTLNNKRKEVEGYADDSSDDDQPAPKQIESDEEPETKTPKKQAVRGERKLAVGVMGRRDDDDRLVFDIKVDTAGSAQRVPVHDYIEEALGKVTVRACQGVSRATYVKDRGVVVEGNDFASVASAALAYEPYVDFDALTCNDISAMLRTYGVEAARATIIQEVTGVFGVYGIDIEPHHLSLIADFMTAGGGYRAMNRTAMMDHSSPYLQMSFETTATFLTNAAQASASDDLTNPSASIVVGQPVKVGTNSFDVMVPLG